MYLYQLLTYLKLAKSNSEAKRLIAQGAIKFESEDGEQIYSNSPIKMKTYRNPYTQVIYADSKTEKTSQNDS